MKFTCNRILSGFMKRNILNQTVFFSFVFQFFLNAYDINRASVVSLRLQSSGVWGRVVLTYEYQHFRGRCFLHLRAEEACNLKMEAAGFFDNFVPMYQTTRRYKLEVRSLNSHYWRIQNLIIKSVVWFFFFF